MCLFLSVINFTLVSNNTRWYGALAADGHVKLVGIRWLRTVQHRTSCCGAVVGFLQTMLERQRPRSIFSVLITRRLYQRVVGTASPVAKQLHTMPAGCLAVLPAWCAGALCHAVDQKELWMLKFLLYHICTIHLTIDIIVCWAVICLVSDIIYLK